MRVTPGVDVRALPITPEDAFVLSRLDGSATEADIALATGLDPNVVRASLEKLSRLGAIDRTTIIETRSGQPRPASTTTSGTFHIGPVVETRGDSSGHHPAAALYDPSELDEGVDLELARKRRILDTFYQLDGVSHYELLGIDASADKKAIKAAYFEIVNVFHPDRYFGKSLGSFKPKLERIFARITEAHDVLTRQASREEYDRYLSSVQRTRALDRTLSDRRGHATELERVEREIQSQVQLEEKAKHSYPPPAGSNSAGPFSGTVPRTPSVSMPAVSLSSPSSAAPSSPRVNDAESRRRALARKLGVSLPPAPRTPPPTSDAAVRENAQADLKRRYEERVAELKRRQVEHYIAAAEKAERAGDLVSATNALRIAASLEPTDAGLLGRLKAVEGRAAAGLAEGYVEQGKYEEREGRWLEAAASYRRAAVGRPSVRVLERVAHCLLNGKGDLKEAADFAKRARDTGPSDVTAKLTLAKIFVEAGMKQSAIGELERAQQLSPNDDTIKDWLRRLRREA